MLESRSARLTAAMVLPERQATSMNTGRITSRTQAMGAAMISITPMNSTTNGRSAISTAIAPESVLRTVSTSRNRDCQ